MERFDDDARKSSRVRVILGTVFSILVLIWLIGLSIAISKIRTYTNRDIDGIYSSLSELPIALKDSRSVLFMNTADPIQGYDLVGNLWIGTGEWSYRSPMGTARSDLCVESVDNRIFVMGGYDVNKTALPTVSAYFPLLDRWNLTKSPMPTARAQFALTHINNTIYAIGGRDTSGKLLAVIEAYNVLTDTWTTSLKNMSVPASDSMALGHNGKVYVFGGYDDNWAPINTVQAYDPVTDTWELMTSMPTARGDLMADKIDDAAYVIGGFDKNYSPLAVNEAYNFTTNKWTTLAPMTIARGDGAIAVSRGKIYVVGGESKELNEQSTSESVPLHAVEQYYPVSNLWTSKAMLPSSRFRYNAAAGPSDNIYIFGGQDTNYIPLTEVEVFYDVPRPPTYLYVASKVSN